MIGADTLMQAAERVLVGNVNTNTTKERERDRRIIAVHEWGHFLVDLEYERKLANGNWEQVLAEMKTIKISLKANPRTNALGFVFHKQGANLLKTKGDIEHDVRVLLGGMANEELFFGEQGTTNGAHNDITRVTQVAAPRRGRDGHVPQDAPELRRARPVTATAPAAKSTRKRAVSWKRRASACTAKPGRCCRGSSR